MPWQECNKMDEQDVDICLLQPFLLDFSNNASDVQIMMTCCFLDFESSSF